MTVNDEPSMPAEATKNLFLLAAGFGVGALIVLFGFVLLVGVGELGHSTVSGPSPASQSAANAPSAPGPAPRPVPNTATPAVPETTGGAPAPANPSTPRASTEGQKEQQKQ